MMHRQTTRWITLFLLAAALSTPLAEATTNWRYVAGDLWWADSDYTADANIYLNLESRYAARDPWMLDLLVRGGMVDYGGGADQFHFDLEARMARRLPRISWCEAGAGLRLGSLGDDGNDAGPLLWLRGATPDSWRVQAAVEAGWVPFDILSDYSGENLVVQVALTVPWRSWYGYLGYRVKDYYNLNDQLDAFGFFLGVGYTFDLPSRRYRHVK